MYFNKERTYLNMLNEAFSIKPLPLNFEMQLCKQGDFYICSHFAEEFVGPPIIIIKGKAYYRFMNFIYLPEPPDMLHREQVIKVCDLRLDYMDKLVDVKFNKFAMETIANCIRSTLTDMNPRLKALDFGCGSGLSSQLLLEYLPNLDIIGIDASKKAISYCHEQSLSAMHSSPGELFPFETSSFDLIFAAFVMHFNIDMTALLELRRVLRSSGKFVFNVYQRSIDRVVLQLHRAGFNSIEVWNNVYGTGVNYAIVSCGISNF
jgi:SAM-dependent methyltransferase